MSQRWQWLMDITYHLINQQAKYINHTHTWIHTRIPIFFNVISYTLCVCTCSRKLIILLSTPMKNRNNVLNNIYIINLDLSGDVSLSGRRIVSLYYLKTQMGPLNKIVAESFIVPLAILLNIWSFTLEIISLVKAWRFKKLIKYMIFLLIMQYKINVTEITIYNSNNNNLIQWYFSMSILLIS